MKKEKVETPSEEELKEEQSADQPEAEEQEASEGQEASPKPQEEDANTKYMRLMADFQNYKRRTEKEKGDIYAYANEKLVSDLLDVIDNFERAIAHNSQGSDGFAEGMEMIFKQFKGVLEKIGLEEIEAQGVAFDPNVHNAVMTEDTAEYDSGVVSAVLQKGYMLNKKVIRPTMVKVAN